MMVSNHESMIFCSENNLNLIEIVDAGTRAVVFDKLKGINPKPIGEGTHFKIPFIQVRSCIICHVEALMLTIITCRT